MYETADPPALVGGTRWVIVADLKIQKRFENENSKYQCFYV